MAASAFGGKGRPTACESTRRTQQFVRLVASGEDFHVAAELARVKPIRALAILSRPEVRQIIAQAA